MGSKGYSFQEEIKTQIEGSIEVKEKIIEQYVDIINDTTSTIIKAYKNGKKVMWCGNGGSAADAQHLACELVSKFYLDRKALRSIALTTNTSALPPILYVVYLLNFSFFKIFSLFILLSNIFIILFICLFLSSIINYMLLP